jgi:predicted nuclease of predicted toxin-antitoxin system
LKLLIDENVSPEITSHLRTLKYNVKSICECCKGFDDEKIVEIALKEERLIVTYDLDFGELYRNFGASSLILRLRTKNPSIVLKYLVNFLNMLKEQKIDMKNKLAIITEGKARLIG